MSNPSKIIGTRWETACVEMAKRYYPWIERRALQGSKDRGDLNHPSVVIECKADKSISDAQCMRELLTEMDNAGNDVGFVWKKTRGKANAVDGVCIVPPDVMFELLRKAGY